MSYLMARPLLADPDQIRLWVGLFDVAAPAPITFRLDNAPWLPTGVQGLHPIRDDTWYAKASQNFQGVYTFPSRGANLPHTITVEATGIASPCRLSVKSLPKSVPMLNQGVFKIMLLSCYCVGMDDVNVGRFIEDLPDKPDMTLFAGDQVYLDQPPRLNSMPGSTAQLRKVIAQKYRRNWLSDASGQVGLQKALLKAPAVCLPDDHEFWNNYPWPFLLEQNTQSKPTATGVNPWDDAARDLCQDFQSGGAPGSQQPWTRLDIEPLCMLFIDTRSHRQLNFASPVGLMTAETETALREWEAALITSRNAGTPRVGLLATGQALFRKPAMMSKLADAELANYPLQFAVIIDVLDNLAQRGIPVIFLTGDVHWSRVAQARNARTQKISLTEVICSPSSLCDMSLMEEWASLKNKVRGIFGHSDPLYRFSEAEAPPPNIGGRKQFQPIDDPVTRWRGNQVAMLTFSRLGTGVEMSVTYHPITRPPALPQATRRFTLLNI